MDKVSNPLKCARVTIKLAKPQADAWLVGSCIRSSGPHQMCSLVTVSPLLRNFSSCSRQVPACKPASWDQLRQYCHRAWRCLEVLPPYLSFLYHTNLQMKQLRESACLQVMCLQILLLLGTRNDKSHAHMWWFRRVEKPGRAF